MFKRIISVKWQYLKPLKSMQAMVTMNYLQEALDYLHGQHHAIELVIVG